jgi:hypothetical protein
MVRERSGLRKVWIIVSQELGVSHGLRQLMDDQGERISLSSCRRNGARKLRLRLRSRHRNTRSCSRS